jgi:predicted PurR-regulated permease PerM
MIAERVLMGLLIGGIAIGCGLVLRPFFSAILWAAILVYTTWPVVAWLRSRIGLPRVAVSLLMVALTALVIVLPLALTVPGGAADVKEARHALEAWLADVPPAPHWLESVPLLGGVLAATWNAWAADLSGMAAFFRPYLGMFAEQGLSMLLGVAGGLVQFFVALFVAFFLWFSGDTLGSRLQLLVHRIAGRYGPQLVATTTRAVRGTVAAFLAVLPIGAPLVWIPAGLWLLAGEHTARGVFLLVYGVVVVSGSDHVIRPYFIARGARIPFVLTVLGVLGGVFAFGALGIFLGPVLLGVGWMLILEFARAESAIDGTGAPVMPAPAMPASAMPPSPFIT